jgi:hypothetical protein
MMHKHFSFLFWVNLFHLLIPNGIIFYFDIILNYTPSLVIFKMGMENKQYGITFELATYLQIRLQLKNFPHIFFYHFWIYKWNN